MTILKPMKARNLFVRKRCANQESDLPLSPLFFYRCGRGRMFWGRSMLSAVLCAVCFFATLPSTYASGAHLHSVFASSYVWRGIPRHDNVVVHQGMDVAYNEFYTRATGRIRADELDEISDQGLLSETEFLLAYRFNFYPDTLELGFTEFMFNVGSENTREVSANYIVQAARFLDVTLFLAYDLGVYEDFYFQCRTRLHGEIAPSLTAFGEAHFAAAGNGFSRGPKGGFHDYGVMLGMHHLLYGRLRWGFDLQKFGSLDKKVLPEDNSEIIFSVRFALKI